MQESQIYCQQVFTSPHVPDQELLLRMATKTAEYVATTHATQLLAYTEWRPIMSLEHTTTTTTSNICYCLRALISELILLAFCSFSSCKTGQCRHLLFPETQYYSVKLLKPFLEAF